MSYILEALNKSEQERRGSKTPDINTIHRPPPGKSAKGMPWLTIILVFGLLNGAALAYWFWSHSTDEPATSTVVSQPAQSTETTNPTRAVANNQTTQPPSPTPAPSASPQSNAQPTVITPRTVFKPAEAAVRITELPTNVQRQIPNLVFSSHLYSDDGDFRMVNINGKMIREGDMVADDLRLLEITEEGVVLSYLHYIFEVSVLRDWSFN